MAFNLAQVEEQVRELSTRDAPGREFCNAIAELAVDVFIVGLDGFFASAFGRLIGRN